MAAPGYVVANWGGTCYQEDPMAAQRLQAFLDDNQVKYVVISHSRAFTAQEVAAATHIPGKELAKSVIVEIDGEGT
jgi:Ala-tRNA(Pro) deacylase